MAGQPNTVNEANNSMAKVMEGRQALPRIPGLYSGARRLKVRPQQSDGLVMPFGWGSWAADWADQPRRRATASFSMRLAGASLLLASWAWQTPKSPWRQLKCWASCNCKPRVCKRTWPVCRERKSSITCFTSAILHDIHDHSDIQIPLSRLRNFNLEKWRICVSLCALPCHPCPMNAFEGSKFHNPHEAGT